MSLNKEAILSAQDLPREEVSVPEWGGTVWIYSLTGAERDAYELSLLDADGKAIGSRENMRAKLLVHCLRDENGAHLFTAKEVNALGGKSAKALDRCFDVAIKLNGFSKRDQDDLVGNS